MAMLLADQRYRFLEHTVKRTVRGNLHQRTWTERIDRILLHRIWGIPVFFAMVLFVFFAAFGPLGSAFTSAADWIVQDWFAGHVREILTGLHASNWVCSLILDGLVTGLGAELSFLPQLAILFLLLSLLEDSGYMARAALLMDHFMRKIGLSGRAFVPVSYTHLAPTRAV